MAGEGGNIFDEEWFIDTPVMDWSLIVFAYNEEATLEKVVNQCKDFIKQSGSHDAEVIIVDDGSTDGTPDICRQLGKNANGIRVIRHEKNLGIGAALRSGYDAASKTYVCAIPADGQFDVRELLQIPAFESSVFYSFYRVEKTGYNNFRKLLTKANQFLNAIILKVAIKDVNWIKVFRRDQLLKAGISLSSSLIETEICYKLIKSGIRLEELPSVYLPRRAGLPKGGSTKTMMQALRELSRLYLKKS